MSTRRRTAKIRAWLDELYLAPSLSGETVTVLPGDVIFYPDLNGHPIEGPDATWRAELIREHTPECFHRSYFRSGGYDLVVMTSYLGVNAQPRRDMPALGWETMIRFPEGGDWKHRYTTQAAAVSAHEKITETIAASGLPLIRRETGLHHQVGH